MRKYLIRICCFALCIALIIPFTSCQQKPNDGDEQFQKGVEYGTEDMFLRIYNSIGFENERTLLYGNTWTTKHFSLTIYDTITKDKAYISYYLTLKNTTVGNCVESDEFFFNIYAISESKGMILAQDDFIWDGAIYYEGDVDEYLQGNTIYGRCNLLDNSEIQTLIIVIATKGYLYSATYNT